MKYKYRIITGLGEVGDERFILQLRPAWWPFWFTYGSYTSEAHAVSRMDQEKKKDNFKSSTIRLG